MKARNRPRKYNYRLLADIVRENPELIDQYGELARLYNERCRDGNSIYRQAVYGIIKDHPELFQEGSSTDGETDS